MQDEIKHWISHHTELLTKLCLDSLFEAAKINEGNDSYDITDKPNNTNNDRQHQVLHFFHRHRLVAELCTVGNELRSSAVGLGNIGIWDKP